MKNPYNHSSKLLFSLSIVWAVVLLFIGVWWIYLISNFENILLHSDHLRITKMIIWEGGSFLILLLLLSITLLILYLKDQKKTKSLQIFFASLTHELKTPLASIRLQGEVINEILTAKNDNTLNTLSFRLIEDIGKLETQMDKILQLSRIERGAELNLTSFKIIPFIDNLSKKMTKEFVVEIESDDMNTSVLADEFTFELIIRNLFENTRIHTLSTKVKMKFTQTDDKVFLTYTDQGHFFGEINKLGNLFYKYNSKGSGIGLYLSSKLLEKMGGKLLITADKNLIFTLILRKSEDIHA